MKSPSISAAEKSAPRRSFVRKTISLNRYIAREGRRKAKQQGRAFSNYVAALIDKDTGGAR